MLPRWFRSLVLVAVAGPAVAQSEPPRDTGPSLAELRARDARLSFTPESARRARAALEGPAEGRDEVDERAALLVALGAGGGGGDAARIEAGLASSDVLEHRAALFAL